MFHVKHRHRFPWPLLATTDQPLHVRRSFSDRQSCQRAPSVLQFLLMLPRETVRELLSPFAASLSDETIGKLLVYLELLMLWNRKINLTAINTPEECLTRHFGESFLISRIIALEGRLLDVGSGGGFPGLAIKLIAPEVEVVLLEPVAKKRAFLKEAARTCGMTSVRVESSRLEQFARSEREGSFDMITVRAVGGLESLIPQAAALLKPGGCLCLWIGSGQAEEIREQNPTLHWQEPLPIPLSHERQILVGRRRRD